MKIKNILSIKDIDRIIILIGIGILVIILGYVLMVTGEVDSFQSIKLAPVVLLIGYMVIIPLSIFYKK